MLAKIPESTILPHVFPNSGSAAPGPRPGDASPAPARGVLRPESSTREIGPEMIVDRLGLFPCALSPAPPDPVFCIIFEKKPESLPPAPPAPVDAEPDMDTEAVGLSVESEKTADDGLELLEPGSVEGGGRGEGAATTGPEEGAWAGRLRDSARNCSYRAYASCVSSFSAAVSWSC